MMLQETFTLAFKIFLQAKMETSKIVHYETGYLT